MAEVRLCKCGCGKPIAPATLAKRPDQVFFARGCVLRWNRAQPAFKQARLTGHRKAAALSRLDRWGQPAYEAIRDACERKGEPLTRAQKAVVMVAIADAIRRTYNRGRNAERMCTLQRKAR